MTRPNTSWTRGDWMQTYTGRQFWPLAPRHEDVALADIAHALAHQCRYGGHSAQFYSVAEHCVLLSHAVSADLALDALLHDAAEAYVVDVPRPLKRQLVGYAAIEDRVLSVIVEALGVFVGDDYVIPAAVKDADNRILLDERAALMRPSREPWGVDHLEPLGVQVRALPPVLAERAFLERYTALAAVTD